MNDLVKTDTSYSDAANDRYLGGKTPAGRPRSPYAKDIREDLRDGANKVGAVLVVNSAGQILVGFNKKRQVWDVPQGTVEKGEAPLATAVRELEEETGLQVAPGELELISQFKHATESFTVGWETFLYTICVPAVDVSGMENLEPEKCQGLAWYSPCQLPMPRGLSLRTALVLMGTA